MTFLQQMQKIIRNSTYGNFDDLLVKDIDKELAEKKRLAREKKLKRILKL